MRSIARLLPLAVVLLVTASCAHKKVPTGAEFRARTAVGQPSLADAALTKDAWASIELFENIYREQSGCKTRSELGARTIAEAPTGDGSPRTPWVEHWVVKRCDADVVYRVAFEPAGKGTDFKVQLLTR